MNGLTTVDSLPHDRDSICIWLLQISPQMYFPLFEMFFEIN